jgi:pyruvate formate lyase activating enzyme
MKIGGIEKLSLIDYPGKTCAVVFTLGCDFRCGYCHNPELVLPEQFSGVIPVDDILDFLKSRVGRLEAVTISGGEPAIHEDLPDFAKKIKEMGFFVKLDTNGTRPAMVKKLLDDKLLDFIAMDIKGPLDKYQSIVTRPVDVNIIKNSIDIIKNSGIPYEFRTTIVKSQLSFDDFDKIGELVKGAPRYALQKFRPGRTLSPRFASEVTYSDEDFEKLKHIMEHYVDECVVH